MCGSMNLLAPILIIALQLNITLIRINSRWAEIPNAAGGPLHRRRVRDNPARSFARPVSLWVSICLTPFSSWPEVETVGRLGARLTVFIWNVDFLECLAIDHKPYHASDQQQYAGKDQPVR